MDQAKAAIIPPARGGIGRVVAQGLAAEGLRVALIARSHPALDETARNAPRPDYLNRVVIPPDDVAASGFAERCVAAVRETWGLVDLLLNRADRRRGRHP